MADITITGMAAAGALTGEELVEIAQLSTTVRISAATISALASDNSYNDSGSGFVAAGFAVNDRVHVSGFTGNTANNIFVGVVTALTTGKMTIGGTDGDVIVDDAAGETVVISKWVTRRAAHRTFRGALVTKSVTQSGANYVNGSWATWDSETYDTDNIHLLASTVTMTIASPGVVTWTGHNFLAGSPVVFTTTGALPTGLTAGTTYYVVNPASNTFQVSATVGGAAINTTGSQSGVHTATNYSRLIVPSGVTRVRLIAQAQIGANTADTWLQVSIYKNGLASYVGYSMTRLEISATSNNALQAASPVLSVTAGDYFEAFINSESDTSVDVNAAQSWFAMEIIG